MLYSDVSREGAGLWARPTIVASLLLLVACAAPQAKQNRISDREGALFWEFESKDGIPSGESRTYYPNGEVRTVGTFLDAEFHGRFIAYRPDGEVAFKAFYWRDVLVWKSEAASAEPPPALLAQLETMHDSTEIRRRFGSPLRRQSMRDYSFDSRSPSASFVYADWRASQRREVGARARVGGTTARGTIGVSETVFGQLPIGAYAASALFTQSQLHRKGGRVWGRSVGQLSGNRSWELGPGQLVAQTSLSFPVASETPESAIATAATVPQSPDMAALAVGNTVAFRATCSWLWRNELWSVQADLGADRTVGGEQASSLTFVRTALAAAYGTRMLYGTVEFAGVGRVGDSEAPAISSAGIGAAFRSFGTETKFLLGSSSEFDLTATLGVEHAF